MAPAMTLSTKLTHSPCDSRSPAPRQRAARSAGIARLGPAPGLQRLDVGIDLGHGAPDVPGSRRPGGRPGRWRPGGAAGGPPQLRGPSRVEKCGIDPLQVEHLALREAGGHGSRRAAGVAAGACRSGPGCPPRRVARPRPEPAPWEAARASGMRQYGGLGDRYRRDHRAHPYYLRHHHRRRCQCRPGESSALGARAHAAARMAHHPGQPAC
jgi:hypothetical protein